ncbi:GAF domain-containing protein [Sphingomonas montana]|uniref:GAF domain-containing protein n=1 Tax=Sphingomonas montana TaxID=1843236 RepID=UPI00097003A7|nr:GAF domain-containing protein [Sphingomonas montana]
MNDVMAIAQYNVLDTAPEVNFDDVVALASQICELPIALISLLDTGRQWFKARIGFEPHQTDLDRSVCRYVVAAGKPIVIPDLTVDARTADNPLVVGEEGIRFYAGVPLVTRSGVVGALCVIDTSPRPDGLAADHLTALERLARQVTALLEMRRDAIELRGASAARDEWRAAQQVSEQRWRDLYRKMDTGFIYARVIRNKDGLVTDWRYEDVNEAWGELVGIAPDSARGRTIREIIPGIEDEWIMELAQVVETREPYRFTRQVGVLNRWYDGTAQWVEGDDFTVIFHEVTTRIEDVRRRDGLLALGDALRDQTDVTEMVTAASRIIGEVVHASRASFGELDHTRELIIVGAGWSLPGMPAIEGSYRFEEYGDLRQTLLDGNVIVMNDTATNSRTSAVANVWEALRACAVAIVPVRERNRTVAALLVHKDHPHVWTEDEMAFLRNAADRLETANARRRDEEQQALVNKEIAHRLKNALSMAQAIAMQTLRSDASPEGLDAFTQRLQALGRGHEALTAGRWKAAKLGDLVTGVIEGAGALDRCTIRGPTVELGARAALSTSLLVHELVTNAMKYGSLSAEEGRIEVVWRLVGSGEDCRLKLDWSEHGGPPASQPTRKGFGSRLIRLGLLGTGGSEVRYTETGFSSSFNGLLTEVEQA